MTHTHTSNLPYDRHHYRMVYEDWSVILKTYNEVQELWNTELSHNLTTMPVVEVIDKPKTKKSKGF
tara:strand:- start:910 stop:1107 length:198 start_codon:yes stop_codon:yes gene_type:complete